MGKIVVWWGWARARAVVSLVSLGVTLGATLGATACAVPVAGGLDDGEANRVFVALDRSSLEAAKEADPAVEGKWRITVARDDLPHALAVLRAEDLPRGAPPTVLDAIGKGTLVPSEIAEHAQLMAGVAGELERSLEGIDGVLSARVHLNVPEGSSGRLALALGAALPGDPPPPRSSAGVLVVHRGVTPPVAAEAVQRLVAGGTPGLLPADVAVVMVSRTAPPLAADQGPGSAVSVPRGSVRALRAALAGLVALVGVLACLTLVLYARLSRLKSPRGDLLQGVSPGA